MITGLIGWFLFSHDSWPVAITATLGCLVGWAYRSYRTDSAGYFAVLGTICLYALLIQNWYEDPVWVVCATLWIGMFIGYWCRDLVLEDQHSQQARSSEDLGEDR